MLSHIYTYASLQGIRKTVLLSRRVAPRASFHGDLFAHVHVFGTGLHAELRVRHTPNLTRERSHAQQSRLPCSSMGSMLVTKNFTFKNSLTSPLVREEKP